MADVRVASKADNTFQRRRDPNGNLSVILMGNGFACLAHDVTVSDQGINYEDTNPSGDTARNPDDMIRAMPKFHTIDEGFSTTFDDWAIAPSPSTPDDKAAFLAPGHRRMNIYVDESGSTVGNNIIRGYKGSDHPYVNLTIPSSNNNRCFLIDTGSSHTLLSPDDAQVLFTGSTKELMVSLRVSNTPTAGLVGENLPHESNVEIIEFAIAANNDGDQEPDVAIEVEAYLPPKKTRTMVGIIGERTRAVFKTAFADDLTSRYLE